MAARASLIVIAFLIAAPWLSPIDPASVLMAGAGWIFGDVSVEPCTLQVASATRLDLSAAIFCFFAFVGFGRGLVALLLPGTALGWLSGSLVASAGSCLAMAGCVQAFGWHPCSEIVGVGGICAAAAVAALFTGAFVKRWLTAPRLSRPR